MPKGFDKWLSREQFFNEVSKRANYLDSKTIELVYYAIVKTIVSECKTSGGVRLPDFGDFTFSWRKEKGLMDVNTREYIQIPPYRMIKFTLGYRLRGYLKQLSDRLKTP
jgi:nucleoid DNA-binding protein